jgi:hypothetical protein
MSHVCAKPFRVNILQYFIPQRQEMQGKKQKIGCLVINKGGCPFFGGFLLTGFPLCGKLFVKVSERSG